MSDRIEPLPDPASDAGLPGGEEPTADCNEGGPLETCADRPRAVDRRAVLGRGARLVYIVPAVLAAMSAKQAFAFS